MTHPFSISRDRQDADAESRHASYVASIKRDPHKLADAINDYSASPGRVLELARICLTAQNDHAEAGRQLAEYADSAAHECARSWMGDDKEVIRPVPSPLAADLRSGKALGLVHLPEAQK